MHNTIDYSKVDPARKDQQALQDIKEWLGIKKYQQLVTEFRWHKQMPLEQFTNLCGIAGISGYPVGVWYKVIWPPNPMG